MFNITEFQCNNSWIQRWKERHQIIWTTKEHGEAASTVSEWLIKLKGICKDYKDKDIFNGDQTGLFYEVQPSGTTKFKHESLNRGKLSLNRVSLLLVASWTGEKNLGVHYNINTKAWMTTDIFNQLLKYEDSRLFLDNFSGHKITTPLTNIKVQFSPANCTSVIQPMDQGIISNFKHFYRLSIIQNIILKWKK